MYHLEWLANPVLVRKKNNEWRMCVDYINLNKHYPKDPFGLPRIDEVVDSTAGCELLSFLDCYSGYHQIALKKDDQIKTSFITPFGAYCYTTIRPNPEKVKAILDMKPPKKVKDVQKLTGCMAALSHFISRLGEKGLPFFKLLKATEKFEWSEEADAAFTQLKQFLTSPLVLTAPREDETLLLYIAATNRVVSTTMVVERDEPATPIRYSGQFISSVRYSTNLRPGTHRFRNCSTPY